MNITSAKFIKGIMGTDPILDDELPQIAFIGRSNAGKSSLLNSLTNTKNLAITSDTPGRTRQLNIFLINESHYFVDLPGYGYAKAGFQTLEKLEKLISWYLLDSHYNPAVVLLIDSLVGPTRDDLAMLEELERAGRNIIVVANKVDKIPKSQYQHQLKKLATLIRGHKIYPYSSKTKVGIPELTNVLLH
ncbi:MAG: ribosome biogenesis GTP-binding protein YihA/YsxC [Patescibacteria group bacterium]